MLGKRGEKTSATLLRYGKPRRVTPFCGYRNENRT